MINLIYASTSRKLMDKDELLDLLQASRKNNAKLNITGMLLYHDGNFLQVLEGEKNQVHMLYDRIKSDPRHYHVNLISERVVEERNFADWTMGFVNIRDVNPSDVAGYSRFLNTPLNSDDFTGNPPFAAAFLNAFKEIVVHP